MKLLEKKVVQGLIPKREQQSHKGTYGKVLLIGGNENLGGAIILAAKAAVYSGAGLVSVATHPSNHAALHAQVAEAMVFDSGDMATLKEKIAENDTILVGPGMGRDGSALVLLSQVFSNLSEEQSLVIDGDALYLIAVNQLALPTKPFKVLSPHQGEWEYLTSLTPEQGTPEKNQEQQKELDSVIVLKKHQTEIYFADDMWQNMAGTAAMATGGMGDVLAGMIAGFLYQFVNPKSAVLAAVFMHSHISDQLAQTHYVTLPSQIIQEIPQTMKQFETTIHI